MDYSRLKTSHEIMSKDLRTLKATVETYEGKNSTKFAELYNSRTKTSELLAELTTTVKMIASSMDAKFSDIGKRLDKMESKIDNLKGARY